MSVSDRWHTAKPRLDQNGKLIPCCREHGQYPSADHGKGDRWHVRWRDESGKQRKRNFAKKQGRDPNVCADAFDKKIGDQLNDGTYIDPNAGKITLGSYGREWRAALTIDPMTLQQIDSRLEKWVFASAIADTAMGVLAKRPSLLRTWIKGMEPHLEASTIRGIVSWVSIIFNAAVDDGVINRNPLSTKSVRPPKVIGKQVVPWTLAALDAAAGALPERFAVMPYLGAGCGHRQGELFGVAVDDVDFLGRVVHVRRQVRLIRGTLVFSLPKMDKTRTVPLPDAVGLRLAAHVADHLPVKVTLPWRVPDGKPVTAELLFTSGRGGALDRNEFNRLWRKARKAAGVPDTRENGMHVLRHTAASAWLAAGVDVRTVAEYLGHADPGFTLRTYSHLMPDAADRARKAMNVFFAGGESSALDVPSDVVR